MNGDFVTLASGFLNSRVVSVFVGNEVGGLDVATVGIFASLEHLLVQFNVVVVDGIIESDGDHHGNILGWQVTGNGGTIFRTETIGQHTNGRIAGRSAVGIVFNVCKKKKRQMRNVINILINKGIGLKFTHTHTYTKPRETHREKKDEERVH